jgi:tRNA1(Val) A37 N6-methylase TrmN6
MIYLFLDTGCGIGTISSMAKNKFNIDEVIGIEKFENAASAASTKLDKVICGEIETLNDCTQLHVDVKQLGKKTLD